jgi:nicotinate-nucleotide pyrophosphorylase (carboxylating)
MLTAATIDSALHLALDEDAPWGDVTGEVFIPAGASARAQLRAREDGVLAGIEVFARTFALVDAETTVELRAADGDAFTSGDVLATVHGSARAVLRAERIALNFCQRMSGIATETRAYVDAAAGRARIADTRKTIPGLRAFDKHAVVAGGGHNHRFGLSDAVMVKDNHLAVLAGEGDDVSESIRAARARLPHTTTIEVEVDRLDQIPGRARGAGPTSSCSTTSPLPSCARASSSSPDALSSRPAAMSPCPRSARSPPPVSTSSPRGL